MSRFSYPKVPGDGFQSVTDMTGPASYAVIVSGTPPSGGQTMRASDFGLASLDWVKSMGSDNGQYVVICIPLGFSAGNPFTSFLLQWVTSATGAEVVAATNLSARTVRLFGFGR
jgi:hypothetical protein